MFSCPNVDAYLGIALRSITKKGFFSNAAFDKQEGAQVFRAVDCCLVDCDAALQNRVEFRKGCFGFSFCTTFKEAICLVETDKAECIFYFFKANLAFGKRGNLVKEGVGIAKTSR